MIGLFDSGYGGLTILRELTKQLPQYDFIYFGDNANAPYGEKTSEEIYELTRKGVEYLFNQGSQLVILACNTASAVALRRLQQQWLPKKYPDKKILGIIVPTIEQITGKSWSEEFGNWKLPAPRSPKGEVGDIENSPAQSSALVHVLATPATVASGAYEHEVHKRNPNIKVVQQACPKLVPLIESAAPKGILVKEISHCLSSLRCMRLKPHAEAISSSGAPSALLLGCTHYEMISHLIKPLLPDSVKLYKQPEIVAKSLGIYLKNHPDLEKRLEKNGVCQFYSSNNTEHDFRLANKLFGSKIKLRPAKNSAV